MYVRQIFCIILNEYACTGITCTICIDHLITGDHLQCTLYIVFRYTPCGAGDADPFRNTWSHPDGGSHSLLAMGSQSLDYSTWMLILVCLLGWVWLCGLDLLLLLLLLLLLMPYRRLVVNCSSCYIQCKLLNSTTHLQTFEYCLSKRVAGLHTSFVSMYSCEGCSAVIWHLLY